MVEFAKKKIILLAERAHLMIFGYEMSDKMRGFVKNLGWSFFGGVSFAVVLLIINVISGRLLGPEGYGKYSLAFSLSFFFSMPIVLGLDTGIVYFMGRSNDIKDRNIYLTSALYPFLLLLIFFGTIFFLVLGHISIYLKADQGLILSAIILGIAYSVRSIADSFSRGYGAFISQAKSRILEALAILIFLLLSFIVFGVDAKWVVYSIAFGYAVFSILWLLKITKNISSFHTEYFWRIFKYAIVAELGGLAGVFLLYFDKIFISKNIGVDQLGIYNAYFIISVSVISQLTLFIVNVFFPTVSGIDDKHNLVAKINRLFKYLAIPLFIIFLAFDYLMLIFFGDKFVINIYYLSLFIIFSIIYSYVTTAWWLIASDGINGIKITSIHNMISAIIFILLMISFRNFISVSLVVWFLLIAYLYKVFVINYKYGRRNR